MKKVLVSLFVVACLFVVTGCGKSSGKEMATGKYTLVEMTQGDTKITKDLLKAAGVEYTLTIKDGKKAVMDMGYSKQDMKYETGMNISIAINMFIKNVLREHKLPFEIYDSFL